MRIRSLTLLLVGLLASVSFGATPDELWRAWPDERFVYTAAPCLRHGELLDILGDLADRYPDRARIETVGRSFEGRSIEMISIGHGPQRVLLWSQMHGDEPSATPALLDIAGYLLEHSEEPPLAAVLNGFTLMMIPMLNPDGSEIYRRRNAQGIDINRDALNLATPEGRTLKSVRDRYEPMLAFNLHDQNRRTAVGDTMTLATNAVLAVAGDAEATVTPGRLRAKRASSAIVAALAPFMPGGMARYDEDWSPRAFGDNITAWGTPVVLIESGGLPPDRDPGELVRLNFVAILTVLQELARDDLAGYDPEVYEALERNESDAWADIVVRGGFLLQPGTTTPYRADLAVNLRRDDRLIAGCPTDESVSSFIFDIGDGRFLGAGAEVDASGGTLLAPFVVDVHRFKARGWLLNDATLARLSRLGVGTVRWSVGRRRLDAAEGLVDAVEASRGTRIEVTAEPPPRSGLVLTAPPTAAESDSLESVLEALAGAAWVRQNTERSPEEMLQNLWPDSPEPTRALPAVRRGQPASFLVVSPAPEGRIDLETTRLEAVWLDGHEIDAAP